MLQGLVKKAWQSAKEAVTIDNTHSLTSWLLPLGQFPSVGSGTLFLHSTAHQCWTVRALTGFFTPETETHCWAFTWMSTKICRGVCSPQRTRESGAFLSSPFYGGTDLPTFAGNKHLYKPHMIKGIQVNLEPVLGTFTSIYGSKNP